MTGRPGADWASMLRFAAQSLAIHPADFWRLSLREWRALTAASPDAPTLSRADFTALQALHPDDPA